jgi:hypothetical protein
MKISRLTPAFLLAAPALLFIAAVHSAPDPAPSHLAQDDAAAPKSAPLTPAPTAAPLRTFDRPDALPGDANADATTSAAIRAAIRADPALAGTDISVNTERGIVSLTGQVLNREQSAIASAYANRPLGVLRVDNELSIPAQ